MKNKKQTIPNLIVIDKEWVENEIKKLVDTHNSTDDDDEKSYYITKIIMLKFVINNSTPLSAIIENLMKGITDSVKCHTYSKEVDYDEVYRDKQAYLSQPITLK
jgi:hypothetical protein